LPFSDLHFQNFCDVQSCFVALKSQVSPSIFFLSIGFQQEMSFNQDKLYIYTCCLVFDHFKILSGGFCPSQPTVRFSNTGRSQQCRSPWTVTISMRWIS
jgi:hypothetical protein